MGHEVQPRGVAHDETDCLLQELKQALSNWYDLPALAESPLAAQVPRFYLLAAGCDRGLALRQLLHEALESLRPGAGGAAAGRAERAFDALRLQYIEGLALPEVQKRLAISRTELYYTRRQGLHALAKFWRRAAQAAPDSAGPEPIPRLACFVGREKELALFRQALAHKHLAVICGMPGVGKTSLGAELVAERDPDRVLWVKFTPGCNTTLESLLEDFARALAARGQPEYLLFLQTERDKLHPLSLHSHAHYLVGLLTSPPPPLLQGEGSNVPPSLAGKGARGLGYTLCLDDYHLVEDDPLITSFCTDLWYAALAGRLDLVVMTRTSQHFAREWNFPMLKGMSLDEAHQLLDGEGLSLSGNTLATVYDKTTGSPIFLKLFAAWIKEVEGKALSEAQVAERAARMESGEAVQAYLLCEVESTLRPEAVRVAIYAAAMRTAFPLRDSDLLKILAAEGIADVGPAFYALQHRHLATTLQANGALAFHPLVKDYFYARLVENPEKKQRVHRQLAGYCEQRREWVEAAYHHLEAGEVEAAAQVLGERVEDIINAGQARAALELAGQVGTRSVSYKTCLARGRLRGLVGDYAEAIYAYTQALHFCTEVEQWAQCHRLLGSIYSKQAEYDQALAHYGEGMALLEGSQAAQDFRQPAYVELARLRHGAGRVYRSQNKYALAQALCEKAAHSLRIAGCHVELAQVYNTLSMVYRDQGDYPRALQCARNSLALAEREGATRKVAEALYDIAAIMFSLGRHPAAIESLNRALELARQVGDIDLAAEILNGLGAMHLLQENWTQATDCFQQALATKEQLGDQCGVTIELSNLGIVSQVQANYATALDYLARALDECKIVDRSPNAASGLIFLTMAEVYYCQGRFDDVLDLCGRNLMFYREANLLPDEASALKLLGKAYLARNELPAALNYLLKAVEIGERMDLNIRAEIYLALAEARLALRETGEALHCAEVALEDARQLGSRWLEGSVCRLMGEVWAIDSQRLGDAGSPKAEECLRRGVALLEKAGTPFELGQAYRSLGQFLRQTGRAEEGQACLDKARETFERIGAKWELERTLATIGEAAQQ